MSQPPYDPRYHTQYSAQQPPPPPPTSQYAVRPGGSGPPLPRVPSFETNDDASSYDRSNGRGPGANGRTAGGTSYEGSPDQQSDAYYARTSVASSSGGRPSPSGPAMSGYRHSHSPQSPPAPQQPYDPAQFVSNQPQYGQTQQQYGAPSRHASVPQPYTYNPAMFPSPPDRRASHHTTPQSPTQGIFHSNTYAAPSPGLYGPASPPLPSSAHAAFPSHQPVQPTLPPPLPARAATQYVPYQPGMYAQNSTQSYTPGNPSPYSTYSPPAPPPPPVPPEPDYDNPYDRAPANDRPPANQVYYTSPQLNAASQPSSTQDSPSPYSADGNNQYFDNSRRFSVSPNTAQGSPLSSPPGPPPHQIPIRTNTGSYGPARPLPPPPVDSSTSEDSSDATDMVTSPSAERRAQEDLYRDVENAVNPGALNELPTHQASDRHAIHSNSGGQDRQVTALFAGSPGRGLGVRAAYTNGNIGHGESPAAPAHENYALDDDPEAVAGAEALRQAEMDEGYFRAPAQPAFPPRTSSHPDLSSGSEYAPVGVDMDFLGGGNEVTSMYNQTALPSSNRPLPVPEARTGLDWGIPNDNSVHPFPSDVRVDRQGTGGLAEPGHERHPSFDDGDDFEYGHRSGSQSPSKDDPYGRTERPLPSVPGLMPAGSYMGASHGQSSLAAQSYPAAPESYGYGDTLLPTGASVVPRSTSLNSHSSTPQPPNQVIRSKTDAEEREARRLSRLQQGRGPGLEAIPGSAVTGTIDLPTIPQGKRKRFNPEKMSTPDFKRCTEPWALSAIAAWLKDMSEGETDLKEKTIVDGIVALFTHKVPTMNIADAETLGGRVVSEMFLAGTLVHEEEWVKFGPEPTSGVLWQLAGLGCYASRLHTVDDKNMPITPSRCYAHHCSKTLKKINLQTQNLEPQRKKEDWATFYKLKKEDLEGKPKKEIERQNNLHEIVQGEDLFLDGMNVLRILYRDALRSTAIIAPNRMDRFIREVFGKVDAVKKVNEDYLYAQMKYRQQVQGPWIVGFSEIFRDWIRKAKNIFIDYAAGFPNAVFLVKKEAERNPNFRQFLEQVRQNERSRRLDYSTFLKSPITRIQHYSLLLSVVAHNMKEESEEKTNLMTAIEEIKAVTRECDARVAEQTRKVELLELEKSLVMRRDMEKVELNLSHLGREVVFRGDLQRIGNNRFTWVDIHAILFDHYLVLSKKVLQREASNGAKQDYYDVSKQPIPMDLLVLESTNDDPVVKTTRLGAVTTVSKSQVPTESRLSISKPSQSPGPERPGILNHTGTASSSNSIASVSSGRTLVGSTSIDNSRDEKIMYPFKVKHLGQSDSYTLYAPTLQNREDWCDKITDAKTKHAASLFAQNAEPFRLRVIADTAFAYDTLQGGQKRPPVTGTPLDRAIREVESTFESAGPRPGPICRASVNCATAFNQPYGNNMVAIGTDYGVYVSESLNPRGWTRAIPISKVTQIAVLEEFSLFIVIADKSLIAYHLDVVCPVNGVPPPNDSARRAPQKLSGARDVGFFATGRMKDRTLVFYKKKDNINSVFKVLEPVFQKSTEKKSRFFRKGTTEFFREFDEFYIPTETYNIHLFNSSLSVGTFKGFEILTLDKKKSSTLPDLTAPHVANIAAAIHNQRPLGMFRLGDEFLLCYEKCAVYVNKHGDVSRSVVMQFVGKAVHAAMCGAFVLLFDNDFVEIRNAQNGRLKQVISGREVKCLDDGANGRTVKIVMQHPELERTQVVVELLVNEGRRELE